MHNCNVQPFSYAELIQWAASALPAWQQDALRRILEQGGLTDDNVDELSEMALSRYREQSEAPAPVAPLPTIEVEESDQPQVCLLSVKDIERVNALAEGPIEFAPHGLTIIYGENGSGKSGIVRVLKKTCSARDRGGAVLSHVFKPDEGMQASARISYSVDAAEFDHVWLNGFPDRNPDLLAVNVFDAPCASVQVEKATFISYTPAVLRTFRELAAGVNSVAERLREKKRALGGRISTLGSLRLDAGTSADVFFSNLNASSNGGELVRLCTMTAEDAARTAELERALTDNAALHINAELQLVRKLENLNATIAECASALGPDYLFDA